jgi:hypothetical protein
MRYWHGSSARVAEGAALVPAPRGYAAAAAESPLERLVEERRPAGAISRAEAVFLVGDPGDVDAAGGYVDFVYEVEPAGAAERHDLAWYTEAQLRLEDGDPAGAAACADAYWAGTPFRDRRSSLFEWLCRSARVVREEPEGEIPGPA